VANVVIQIDPLSARLPATQLPALTSVPAATVATNPSVTVYAFDGAGTTKQYLNFVFRASNYASGNVTVDIDFWMTGTATTGNVKWECAIGCITPSDAQGVTTDTFATATTTTTTVSGTAKGLVRSTVTVSNLDSLAADDIVTLQLDRDPANDTCTDSAGLHWLTVSYLSV
jgi:hypothetical protein